MCGNKNLPSALSTCCGTYADRDPYSNPDYADVLSEYRFEALTYQGNVERCAEWGKEFSTEQPCGRFCLMDRDLEFNCAYKKTAIIFHLVTYL